MRARLLLLGLLGTASVLGACCRSSKQVAVARAECLSPLSYGAVVNDGRDDRAAIQSAIDAASTAGIDVCLPRGDLHVGRREGAISSLQLAGTKTSIRGEGDRSRLVMLDQPSDNDDRDWWVLEVTGTKHVVADFSMEGTARGVTNEQTHLIQVLGPAREITLERLTLALPVQTISKGGDCIRMLGEPDARVEGVTISDVRGESCARSFIAFQRFVSKVLIDRVRSVEIGGGAIDMEPTGDGAIHDVTIRRSDFRRGSVARGGWTIALAGSQTVHSEQLVLEDCVIEAGIWVYRVKGATIQYNKLHGGPQDRGMIKVVKDSEHVLIENNLIERDGDAGNGVEISSHNGKWPRDIVIRNNEIVLRTDGAPIHGEPVEGIEIVDNTITCTAPSGRPAVYLRGVATPISKAHVRSNAIRGHCSEAVRIVQHGEHVTGSTVVEDNVVEGTKFGVIFENGGPGVKPVIDRNVFKGVSGRDQVVGSERHGFAGRNSK
ncbi:MAG: right-handed parallel beta-helix repeat-containing protein [Deltaproteobacteria bacterium]|nr:right-handed parallel beta-helix repeat-containing protein [Deltaproteobacteria bacterium]